MIEFSTCESHYLRDVYGSCRGSKLPPEELLAWVSGSQEGNPSKSQSAVIRVRAYRTLELWAKPSSPSSSAAPSSWEITVQMEQWPASHTVQLVWAESSSDHTDSQLNLLSAPSCLDLKGGLRTRDIGQRAQCIPMSLGLYTIVIVHLGSICLFPKDNALPFHNAWPRTRRLQSHGVGINGSIRGKIQHLLTKIESHHFNLSLKRILETKHKATCNGFGCQHVWKHQHFKKPFAFCLGLTYIRVR